MTTDADAPLLVLDEKRLVLVAQAESPRPTRRAVLVAAATATVSVIVASCGAADRPTTQLTQGVSVPAATPDLGILDRLRDAIGSHDPQRVAACFTEDYRCEIPLHPERSFTGTDAVRRNWTAMFASIPDIRATILRTATNGPEIWSEWEMSGTTPAGTPASAAGPVILATRGDKIAWARFYLERRAQ